MSRPGYREAPECRYRRAEGEQERRGNRSDFGKGGGKSGSHSPYRGRENLACQKVGLSIWAEIGHKIEQHETEENQHRLGLASVVHRKRSDQQTGPTELKGYPPNFV